MKCFTMLLVLFSVVVYSQQQMSDSMRQKLRQINEKCMKESGADSKLLMKARTGERVNDKKVKCFYKCSMMGTKVMDSKGNITPENFIFKSIIPEARRAKVFEVGNKCKAQVAGKSSDLCETAYSYDLCIAAERKKMYN